MTANCYTNVPAEFESPSKLPYETGADVYRAVSPSDEQFTGILNCWQSTGPSNIVDVDDEEEGIVLQDSSGRQQANYPRKPSFIFSRNGALPRSQLQNFTRTSTADTTDPNFKLGDIAHSAAPSGFRFGGHAGSDCPDDASGEDRRQISSRPGSSDKRSHPTGRFVSRHNPSYFLSVEDGRSDSHQRPVAAGNAGQNNSKSGRRYFAQKDDFSSEPVNFNQPVNNFRRHQCLKNPSRQFDFAAEPIVLPSTECNSFRKQELMSSPGRGKSLCSVTTEPMEIDADDSEEGLLHEESSHPSPVSKASASSSPGKTAEAPAVKGSPRTGFVARVREKTKHMGIPDLRSQSEITADSFLLSGQISSSQQNSMRELLSTKPEGFRNGVGGNDHAELDVICVNDDLQAAGLDVEEAITKTHFRCADIDIPSDSSFRPVSPNSSEKLKDQQMTDKDSTDSADGEQTQAVEIEVANEEVASQSLAFRETRIHLENDGDETEVALAKLKNLQKKDEKVRSSRKLRKLELMEKEPVSAANEIKGRKERRSVGVEGEPQKISKSARSSKKLQTKREEHAQVRDMKKTGHLKKAMMQMRRRGSANLLRGSVVMKSELRGADSSQTTSDFNPEEVYKCGLLLRYRVACEEMRQRICALSSEYLGMKATENQLMVEMGADLGDHLANILSMSNPNANKFADLVAAAVAVSATAKQNQRVEPRNSDSNESETASDSQPVSVKQKKRHKHGHVPT